MMTRKSNFLKRSVFVWLFAVLTLVSCTRSSDQEQKEEDLYGSFKNPPVEARPFVRWWWNGNRLEENEIVRQLDILKKAGIGGVEINPIALPGEAKDVGASPMIWRSEEWNAMLKFASEQVGEREMIADLIVGSGWPFGGEFLKEDEAIQRIIVNKISCSGGQRIEEGEDELYEKAVAALSRSHEAAKSHAMVFIRLIPKGIKETNEIIDLFPEFQKNKTLDLVVPDGEYELVYGMLQRSNREVVHGAPGAAGPVMNHYDKKITRAYLSRLEKISEDTGVPLNKLIRALFCDSIELDGSNWTDDFGKIFFNTYGYKLEPWFPFVFYDPNTGYAEENYDEDFKDQLKRVRYDYNKLLVDVFLDNFTQEFQDFCTEKGVLCRYQAYGTPFLMGMMEGNMIADIPESNNWIYSADMDSERWTWNQQHGYMIWNLYAASGGHLRGKKIISNEAMTNTRGVFKTSLEEIKQHDDMNFITGMTHTVLHGYNYSPERAGFPGWIRYGAYFNEQNPWWPFFRNWSDYNSRLSAVFQQSVPVKNIAILAPEADTWSTCGLIRAPFHTQPWYCFRLWESISQAGSSCDYISSKIIREGSIDNGKLAYGPMSYNTLLLGSIRSMDPKTALMLLEFVKEGGKLVAIDDMPFRSPSFSNASINDSIVQAAFLEIKENYPDRFFLVESPENEEVLLNWTEAMLKNTGTAPDVKIASPDKSLYQIRKKAGEKEIFFFTNSHRTETVTLETVFPTDGLIPWEWNPEDGTRKLYPHGKSKNDLIIRLDPLQSLLLVFEPDAGSESTADETDRYEEPVTVLTLNGNWKAEFEHINGKQFARTFDELHDFGTSQDPELNAFAGTVTYSTDFTINGAADQLVLGKVNKGVTEVYVNGKKAGVNWYGKPVFDIKELVREGENHLEIKYTTVLSNYVMSMKDDPTAARWTRGYVKIPSGLEGTPVIQAFSGQ